MPELSAFLDDDEATDDGSIRFFAKMSAIDAKTRENGALDDLVLMTALFYDPLEEATHGMRDLMGAVNDFLDPVIDLVAEKPADGVEVALEQRTARLAIAGPPGGEELLIARHGATLPWWPAAKHAG